MKHITILLILFLSTYTLATAQYEIGHQTFTLNDPSRSNREITGHIYYPADTAGDNVPATNEAFPFISFGHGFGMSWNQYQIWWETLVPQGYILAFATTENGVFPFPDHAEFGEDLAFVIDAYLDENDLNTSDFYQKLSGKNAVMGHSMGGGCSYLAEGNFDADITTIITLAAADTDPSAITEATNINVPVLTIAGSADCVVMDGGAPIDIYNGLNNTPYKAYVEINDASHCQFGIASTGSICTLGEFCGGFLSTTEQHNQMFLSASPWLDYFLKEDCDAWDTFHNHLITSSAHTYQEAGTPFNLSVEIEVIDDVGDLLIVDVSGGSLTYQWLLDGNPIDGATSNTYNVYALEVAGPYSLEITNEWNCSIISNEVFHSTISNTNLTSNIKCEVFPIPSKSELNIKWNELESMESELSIFDISGKEIYKESYYSTSNSVRKIDVSTISSGMYYISIDTEKGIFVQKIIKI